MSYFDKIQSIPVAQESFRVYADTSFKQSGNNLSPMSITLPTTTDISVTNSLSIHENTAYGMKIDEDHVNYVLMYDMLTGIRIAVSRNQAKNRKALESKDFKAAHKLAFDIIGNELTPSSRYDFKFKDYAPWVFRELRELFRIDPAEYLISLTGKYVLSELGSPGKSGSFFYYSQDYRFIIKTIRHNEHLYLRKILLYYYEHVKNNSNTLLSRFIGLHRVKLPKSKKIHFVVMGNIFPQNRMIHEIYDIKGSTLGRYVSSDDIKSSSLTVRKDRNWIQSGRRLLLSPEKRAILLEQLIIDERFLESLNIMDYSLLVGIHCLNKGTPKNLPRDRILSVYHPKQSSKENIQRSFHPSLSSSIIQVPSFDQPFQKYLQSSSSASAVVLSSSPPSFTLSMDQLPSERAYFRFYQDLGGFGSTDEHNEPLEEIYYLGIIDILTPYKFKKKLEHALKTINYDASVISAINPRAYGRRFLDFIRINILQIDHHNSISLTPSAISRRDALSKSLSERKSSDGLMNGRIYKKSIDVGTSRETLESSKNLRPSFISMVNLSRYYTQENEIGRASSASQLG